MHAYTARSQTICMLTLRGVRLCAACLPACAESNSVQASTARSQTLHRLTMRGVRLFFKGIFMRNILIFRKFAEIQSWLTIRGIDSTQANTARRLAGTNFFHCRPLLALIGKIFFFFNIWELFQFSPTLIVSFLTCLLFNKFE